MFSSLLTVSQVTGRRKWTSLRTAVRTTLSGLIFCSRWLAQVITLTCLIQILPRSSKPKNDSERKQGTYLNSTLVRRLLRYSTKEASDGLLYHRVCKFFFFLWKGLVLEQWKTALVVSSLFGNLSVVIVLSLVLGPMWKVFVCSKHSLSFTDHSLSIPACAIVNFLYLLFSNTQCHCWNLSTLTGLLPTPVLLLPFLIAYCFLFKFGLLIFPELSFLRSRHLSNVPVFANAWRLLERIET